MLNNVAQLLGRALLSAIFIKGGIEKAMNAQATIAGFSHYPALSNPSLSYAVALAVEIGGGIAVLVGWKTRWAALILAAWCIATGLVAHYHPGDRGQMIHFMKNICMAGGFLQLFVLGAGRFSFDKR